MEEEEEQEEEEKEEERGYVSVSADEENCTKPENLS